MSADYASRRFQEIQGRLHRQYGPGLHKLTASLNSGALGQASPMTDPATGETINADGTETINGVTINVTSPLAFPLGLVAGLQYD